MSAGISEKWIKASIAGTIWAASEIVLGSFLHNLKVPFSGNILTAIGLVLLISISYKWNEKGLFWRAGLICALLKTMSPSAVIFGPMIAILAESFLLEASVRILGRTLAGYIIGAMLAMSWNLFQKILNYIIFYGANIIEVYKDLLKLAQKQLNIQSEIVWIPIIILLIIYALFGMFTAIIGIRVGRQILKKPAAGFIEVENNSKKEIQSNHVNSFNYSVLWLFFNISLIILAFYLLNKTSWIVWSLAISGIIVIWAMRYSRALRQLAKPKFWLLFVLITALTAFVFTNAGSGEGLIIQGLLTGLQMNFRAVLVIVGFSALGTELYNPTVRNFFLRTSFKNLPLAMELSVESLPAFIANIPDFKTLVRNPVSIFHRVISQAETRLSEIWGRRYSLERVIILSGSVGEGKTTYLEKLCSFLKENGKKVGGIISLRVTNNSTTIGYDLVNIETGDKEPFLRQDGDCGTGTIGKFTICPEGLAMGINILSSLQSADEMFVIIDEIGLLELQGGGWANCFDNLLQKPGNKIIITVRDKFIDEVITRWRLSKAFIIKISENDPSITGRCLMV